ncbi:hypothetical protein ABPG72_010164 [Tetrahymena utriculariae]
MTNFGSPFRNTGSGIVIRDPENEKRIKLAFQNFWKSKQDDKEFQAQIQTAVSKDKVNFMFYASPLFGALLGKAYIDMFCNPRYFYFRAFTFSLFTLAGYCVGNGFRNRYEHSLYTRNYHLFPKDLQDALVNGDARYCIQWWKQ